MNLQRSKQFGIFKWPIFSQAGKIGTGKNTKTYNKNKIVLF